MSDCCQSCKLIPSGIAAATSCRETVILVSLVYHLYLKRLSCLPTSRRRHKDSSLRLTMALWQLNLSHAACCTRATAMQRFRCGHRQGHSRALNLIVHVCMSFFRRRDQKKQTKCRGAKPLRWKSRTQRSRWILTPRGSNKTAKNVKKAARCSSHATLVVQPVFSLPGVLKGHEKLVAA